MEICSVNNVLFHQFCSLKITLLSLAQYHLPNICLMSLALVFNRQSNMKNNFLGKCSLHSAIQVSVFEDLSKFFTKLRKNKFW